MILKKKRARMKINRKFNIVDNRAIFIKGERKSSTCAISPQSNPGRPYGTGIDSMVPVEISGFIFCETDLYDRLFFQISSRSAWT